MFNNTVPVLFAGMWPSQPEQSESGTRVAIIEKEGGPVLLEGFSDPLGDFHGRLPATQVGKNIYIVVREPGFKYDYFNPIRVERWGLFLAIRQEKDHYYNGAQGAKSIDPAGWENWNSTQEHIRASHKIHDAVRRAKIAWPLRPVGFIVAVCVGIAGFFVSPLIGLFLGIWP